MNKDGLLKVGIVGTGYAAKKRAEAFQKDTRTKLTSFTGNTPEKNAVFAEMFDLSPINSWQQLVNSDDVDLVVICSINRDRAAIARAALEAGKHVIAEYPLALEAQTALEIIQLAKAKNLLLHVEHIELMGGLHRAIAENLPNIGNPVYARYITIAAEHPAPRRWSYHYEMFGFPLAGALSRVNRLTDLFGKVASVSCQSRYWNAKESGYFTACLCSAQLRFYNGLIGEITYGKGEVFWQSERTFEIHGDRGTLIFHGEKGNLIRKDEKIAISVASRQGLFTKDSQMVVDRLLNNSPLYVQPEASYYALQIAEAARLSATEGKTIDC
jgi:biliverdin reductase